MQRCIIKTKVVSCDVDRNKECCSKQRTILPIYLQATTGEKKISLAQINIEESLYRRIGLMWHMCLWTRSPFHQTDEVFFSVHMGVKRTQ